MTLECGREQEVIDAVASGRWPERCDDELRAHVAVCGACADLVEIAGPIAEERDLAWEAAKVPPASVVWWRARIRAREEAMRAAARPLNVVSAIALLFFGAIGGALFVTLLPGVRTWWSAMVASIELPSTAGIAAVVTPLTGSTIVVVAVATSVLLGPVAIWYALRDDS